MTLSDWLRAEAEWGKPCLHDHTRLEDAAEEIERLWTALRWIADITHRHKRMVCGVPHGPLAQIADIVEEAAPSPRSTP